MKTFLTGISIILFLSFSGVSYSQDLKLGIGGGLTLIQSPDAFTNNIPDGAGFDSEYHIGLKLKLSLPVIPITPYGFIQYHFLRGDGNTALGNIETSQNIFTLGAGGALELVPGPLPIKPFLLLDLSYNNFGDSEVSGASLNVTSSGGSRVGLGIGGGVSLSLLVIDVEVTAKYNFFNLIGKEDGEETISAIILNASVFFGS